MVDKVDFHLQETSASFHERAYQSKPSPCKYIFKLYQLSSIISLAIDLCMEGKSDKLLNKLLSRLLAPLHRFEDTFSFFRDRITRCTPKICFNNIVHSKKRLCHVSHNLSLSTHNTN